VSSDGKRFAFVEGLETNALDGVNAAYTRTLDAQPVQLGNAHTLALSPDGAFVIGVVSETAGLKRLPTGMGAPVPLDRGKVQKFDVHDEIEMSSRAPRVVFRGA